ncbi:hypothetical protein E4U41_001068 [Claviceps citrina]|nr:hypothetical protein E4U41_001068 [Claviceps citrina]
MADQIQELVDTPSQFVKDGVQFMNKCQKPDQKEFTKICQAVGTGFVVMGVVGYVVKLTATELGRVSYELVQNARTSGLYRRGFAGRMQTRSCSNTALQRLKINAGRLYETLHYTWRWGAANLREKFSAPTETGMSRIALSDDDAKARRWLAEDRPDWAAMSLWRKWATSSPEDLHCPGLARS